MKKKLVRKGASTVEWHRPTPQAEGANNDIGYNHLIAGDHL